MGITQWDEDETHQYQHHTPPTPTPSNHSITHHHSQHKHKLDKGRWKEKKKKKKKKHKNKNSKQKSKTITLGNELQWQIQENQKNISRKSCYYWNVPLVRVSNEFKYRSVCARCGIENFDFSSTPTPRDWILGEIDTSVKCFSGIMEWLAPLALICLCICGDIASNAIVPVPEFWRESEGGGEVDGEEEVDMMEWTNELIKQKYK